MVRAATPADVPAMIELGRQFYEAAEMGKIPFNPASTACLLREMLNSPLCAIFLMERDGRVIGGIGGTIGPATYNFDYLVCLENFWFIDPRDRGGRDALLLPPRLEEWAREQGAVEVIMGAFRHLKIEILDRLYQRRLGYTPCECLYRKEL